MRKAAEHGDVVWEYDSPAQVLEEIPTIVRQEAESANANPALVSALHALEVIAERLEDVSRRLAALEPKRSPRRAR